MPSCEQGQGAWEEHRDTAASGGRKLYGQSSVELVLQELWGTIKRDFLNKTMAVGSAKVPLACSRKMMVTSQTEIGTRLGCSVYPLPPSLTQMNQEGPGALSWRTMTVRMNNPQLTPVCCSRWIPQIQGA